MNDDKNVQDPQAQNNMMPATPPVEEPKKPEEVAPVQEPAPGTQNPQA